MSDASSPSAALRLKNSGPNFRGFIGVAGAAPGSPPSLRAAPNKGIYALTLACGGIKCPPILKLSSALKSNSLGVVEDALDDVSIGIGCWASAAPKGASATL